MVSVIGKLKALFTKDLPLMLFSVMSPIELPYHFKAAWALYLDGLKTLKSTSASLNIKKHLHELHYFVGEFLDEDERIYEWISYYKNDEFSYTVLCPYK